jgi:hypothetical protein
MLLFASPANGAIFLCSDPFHPFFQYSFLYLSSKSCVGHFQNLHSADIQHFLMSNSAKNGTMGNVKRAKYNG